MNRSFVEDDSLSPKIDVEFGIAAKKAFRDLPRLTYQIALIFMQLFVFSRIITNDNQFYRI